MNTRSTSLTILLVVLFAALLPCISPAATTPLYLTTASSHPLEGHLEYFTDPTGKLTLADILSPTPSVRFTPLAGNLSKSYSRDTVWVRFNVIRAASFPEDAFLRLVPAYLDHVTVYLQTGNDPAAPSSYREIRLGDHVPALERPVRHAELVTPILLPLEKPVTLLIQIRSTSVLNLAGAIHTPTDIISQSDIDMMLQGGYLGIALVIALVNLIYFLRIRDRLFLYFSLYVLAISSQQIGVTGFTVHIWPAAAHILSDYLTGMSLGAMVVVFSPFAMRLFQTSRTPWPHRYLVAMSLMGGVTMLSVPLDFYGSIAPLLLLGTIGTIVLMFLLSFRAVKNREPGGTLYLAAFGISNLGYTAQILRLLGVFPLAWWNANAVQYATLINMVMMTLALTERLRVAEEKATAAAQESEKKAVMLAEEMTVELRNALANEQQAVQRQNRFLAMLSHEYRTPLAIIQANLDLLELKEGATKDGTARPHLTTMKHAVNRLVEVMEVSLRKERMVSTAPHHIELPLQVIPFLDEVIDSAEKFWPERTFIFQPETAGCTLTGDAAQLKTAILNLLDNACKYSPPDTPVSIECHTDQDVVTIAIHDRGHGILPADAENLFDKYHRGTNTPDTSGAGIGLWLVRQIVQQHGGNVSIAGREGGGCTVLVQLPLTGRE